MRASGMFDLVACCDRDEAKLREVCELEEAGAAPSYEAMLDTPGLEAVVISTGVDSHAPFALEAMRRGLHVFVEKPLCSSVEEARELLQVAGETGCIFGSGHNNISRYAVAALVREWMESGKLGTVAAFEQNSSHSGGLEIRPGDWRGIREKNPGGMLMQCGVHALHMLQELFGPVESLSAMMRDDVNPATETADVANVLVRMKGGILGTLNCYHVTAYVHEFRIFGTRGNLYVDTQDRRVWFQPRLRNQLEERVEIPVPESRPEDLFANLTSWAGAIRGAGKPDPDLEAAVRAVVPVFAAQVAATESREVKIEEVWSSRANRS